MKNNVLKTHFIYRYIQILKRAHKHTHTHEDYSRTFLFNYWKHANTRVAEDMITETIKQT